MTIQFSIKLKNCMNCNKIQALKSNNTVRNIVVTKITIYSEFNLARLSFCNQRVKFKRRKVKISIVLAIIVEV